MDVRKRDCIAPAGVSLLIRPHRFVGRRTAIYSSIPIVMRLLLPSFFLSFPEGMGEEEGRAGVTQWGLFLSEEVHFFFLPGL